MANVLKHRFSSGKADGADATQIQPSHWNDGHNFSGGNAGDLLTRDPTDATYGAKWAPPAALGVWTPYSPVWSATGTAPTYGNGSLSGSYARVGAVCWFGITLSIGSTTTLGTGTWLFSLPFPTNLTGGQNGTISGFAAISGLYYIGLNLINTATTVYLVAHGQGAAFGPANPAAWATGSNLFIAGWFPIALGSLRDLLESADIVRPSDAEVGPVIIG